MSGLSLKELNNEIPVRLASGHRLCAGCAESIIARQVLMGTEKDVAVSCSTGCFEVSTTIFPYTSWKVPMVHTAFGNGAAGAAGLETAYKSLKRQGKTDKDIQDKIDELWNHYFGGQNDKTVYYEDRDGGYIVDTFAIALWGLQNFKNFKDGMMAVIRLGGDTDTNAACYGQLAGAYYGYEAIPEEWRKGVYLSDELVKIADELLEMDECVIKRTRFEDDEFFKPDNA